jgi:hypothetical protein
MVDIPDWDDLVEEMLRDEKPGLDKMRDQLARAKACYQYILDNPNVLDAFPAEVLVEMSGQIDSYEQSINNAIAAETAFKDSDRDRIIQRGRLERLVDRILELPPADDTGH